VARIWKSYQDCLKNSGSKAISRLSRKILQDTIPNYEALFRRWKGIRRRCYAENAVNFRNYGGRGIKLAPEFEEDSQAFCEYIASLPGYFEGANLDRIDNNKGYERGNIRWTSAQENMRNKRNNRLVVVDGQERVLQEWIESLPAEIQHHTKHLVHQGYTPDEALLKPLKRNALYPFRGESLTRSDFHRRYCPGIGMKLLHARMKKGKSFEDIYQEFVLDSFEISL